MSEKLEQAYRLLRIEVISYALLKGENWRCGEGTEIMDALNAILEILGEEA